MANSKVLNQTFIQCFLKKWRNITKEESFTLRERKHTLDQKFEFTNKTMQKLRGINDFLKKEEKRISKKTNYIHLLQEELLAKKLVDDFEIEFELHCFNESFYPKTDQQFEKDSFYVDYTFSLFYERVTDNTFFTDNWNEFHCRPGHPLSNESHCYTLHHLYDHTYLAWEDILGIENIWIEMKIANQFIVDLPIAVD